MSNDNRNIKIINSDNSLNKINFKEIVKYKDLLYYMILKEVKILYKQTILGFSWAIIRPVLSMIIFSIIFGNMARLPSDGIPYPLFSYVGLVPWVYFSSSLTKSTQSLIVNMTIFTKVYFPRIILPLTPIVAGLVDFFIALSIVFVLMFWYGIVPSSSILWIPLLILIMMIFSLGIGLWLSALSVQYRDIRHAIQFITQLLMYSAPVVWPVSLFVEKFGNSALIWYGLYPMAGVIEGFRSAILGVNPMPWQLIIMGLFSSLVILKLGARYFRSKENYFADIV